MVITGTRVFRQVRQARGGSRGFVLLMTLIVLVILTLSALAMMRLMGSGITTAGNIAFRQAATRAGDLGIEGAFAWLKAQTPLALQSDDLANGYYAAIPPSDPTDPAYFSPQTFSFTDATKAKLFVDANGNDTFSGYKIYYVIHRMSTIPGACLSTVNNTQVDCAAPIGASASVTGAGSSHLAGSGYQLNISGSTGLVYYRITAKVVGPRFNNRYVQVFVF